MHHHWFCGKIGFMAEPSKEKVRVRIAPSPTGQMHVGTARTALFNWLFARQHGGTFVLRIEDTDVERSKKEYEAEIFEGLEWLGMTWDEGPDAHGGADKGAFGPYRQSERTSIYRKYLQELLEKGEAYYCYCTKEDLEAQRQALLAAGLPPRYNGHCRNLVEPPAGRKPEVIRFKVPETKIEFKDLIHGKTVFDTALFGDQVIAKDLDTPLYNFAVVVDDALMEITHVIRGEDHLSNTPKQILMQHALGFPTPHYAHLPLILNPDRSKMSKRFADVALLGYCDRGYLPDGIINFIGLLGWHPKDDHEVFTRDYALEHFEMSRVQQSGAIFNEEKLDFVNREHMRMTPIIELVTLTTPFYKKAGVAIPTAADENYEILQKVVALQLGRAKTLVDVVEGSRFFFAMPEYDAKLLYWKETSVSDTLESLRATLAILETHAVNQFERVPLLEALTPLTEKISRGGVLWPLRVSLSGQAASPDPMEIMEVLGKKESLARLSAAIEKLSGERLL
jgi:nondiscriminating glutamyl-tRNA synthetase